MKISVLKYFSVSGIRHFYNSNSDHDFNMFRSGAGGACDCGDTSVMDKCGICPAHRTSEKPKKTVPEELLNPSSGIIIKVLHRLLHDLRKMFLEQVKQAFEKKIKFSGFVKIKFSKKNKSRQFWYFLKNNHWDFHLKKINFRWIGTSKLIFEITIQPMRKIRANSVQNLKIHIWTIWRICTQVQSFQNAVKYFFPNFDVFFKLLRFAEISQTFQIFFMNFKSVFFGILTFFVVFKHWSRNLTGSFFTLLIFKTFSYFWHFQQNYPKGYFKWNLLEISEKRKILV